VGAEGFEPPMFTRRDQIYSLVTHHLSRPDTLEFAPRFGRVMYGWQGRTRTDMQLINSESAYQVAHLPRNWSG
jgi:hypothetical protein